MLATAITLTLAGLPPLSLPPLLPTVHQGAAFRSALALQDVQRLRTARTVGHGSWLLPIIAYAATEPRPRLFPCSLSWVTRRGLPKRVHTGCYVLGWGLVVAAAARATSLFAPATAFIAQVAACGALSTVLCPLGGGRLQTGVHYGAAVVYVLGHLPLMRILDMRPLYRRAFFGCLALVGVCQPFTDNDVVRGERAARGEERALRRCSAAEYGFMLGEYGLFVAFCSGMLSGLPKIK